MTNNTSIGSIFFGPAFKEFDKFFVGFDDSVNKFVKLHDEFSKNIPTYPPYNIRKIEDNKYVIEMAVAGFSKTDIEISLENNKLVIGGKTADDQENNYLFKGIANRAFSRTFVLDEKIEVKDASMINGMLKLFLEKIIPEENKPKKISVRDDSK